MKKRMTTIYKRYCYSLEEIEQELLQIKENFESLYEESIVIVEADPYPKTVKYNGEEKEFIVKINIERKYWVRFNIWLFAFVEYSRFM